MQDKIKDFLETYSKQTTLESQLAKVKELTGNIQNCLKWESPVDRLKELCKAISIDTENCEALKKVYLQDPENFEKLARRLRTASTLTCDKGKLEELGGNIVKQKPNAASINLMIAKCLEGSVSEAAATTQTMPAETDNSSFMSAMSEEGLNPPLSMAEKRLSKGHQGRSVSKRGHALLTGWSDGHKQHAIG
jgi:hypothetical protein